MKILHIGKQGNVEKYTKKADLLRQHEILEASIGCRTSEYLAIGADAEVIIVDAIGKVQRELIEQMSQLKLIHSEGVAFHLIDCEAAREKGVYVCNSQGMNASAVAEQTVLLMTGMLRGILTGDRAVREGRQICVKEEYMVSGNLLELADCTVGLIGFGGIAKATARLLRAYGVKRILYNKRHALEQEEEHSYGVIYASLPQLLSESDMVSLHVPVSEATFHMADHAFFAQMKEGSYLVNTARGELVDDEALIEALRSGKLVMAGLDTLDQEPVQPHHPLLQVEKDIADRMLFSPHIGGITASSFRRSYEMIWENIQALQEGNKPKRIVNGL